jgi:hypothetical protein
MPHGAVSALADQNPHKKPTTSPGRSLRAIPHIRLIFLALRHLSGLTAWHRAQAADGPDEDVAPPHPGREILSAWPEEERRCRGGPGQECSLEAW